MTEDATLERANQAFHEIYDRERRSKSEQDPVWVLLGGELTVCANGERRSHSFARVRFDAARTAAHLAVALYVGGSDGQLRIERALASVRDDTSELGQRTSSLLERCVRYVHSGQSGAEREAFAHESGPQILELTELATREQLGALHRVVERVVHESAPEDLATVHAVVAGDHQARRRSLGMQYFARRLPDDRVTYGENVRSVDDALLLVGTCRLDHAIARAFFGDKRRLQEDILGAAAERALSDMTLEPISGSG